MRYLILILFVSFLCPAQTITLNEKKAFPTAEGFGKNATGGRGGSVLFVTNTNNSGAGSLRAALEASGTRTVIFRIGGTINLSSPIWIENGNLTIAGETAPGDGILIRGNKVEVNASNVIIRNIRFRLGTPTSGTDVDAFSITAPSSTTLQNIVIDHCSFSWGDDENFNIRGSFSGAISKNITVQNSIISEGSYGALLFMNVQNVSFYQNLLALNSERNIRANYGYEDVFKFEMVNNLIYGWAVDATNPSNGQKYTIINNKYKLSSEISTSNTTIVNASAADSGVPDGWTYAYIDGNIIPGGYTLNASRVNAYLESTPYATSGLVESAYPASEIEGKILTHVGASLSSRDAVDARIVQNYNDGDGVIASSGTYPTISSGTPYTDSNGDGISDTWASLHGISSSSEVKATYMINGKTIINDAEYTALEIFFADLAGDFDRLPLDENPIIIKKNEQKKSAATNILNW